MPKPSKALSQLLTQIDDDYPSRDRRSDGIFADARHLAQGNSDHIPDPRTGIVRGLDIDADLRAHKSEAHYLADRIRLCAKRGDKRISYVIYDRKIASKRLRWKWRKYRGINPHQSHIHISFTKAGDNDGSWFNLEGVSNG